MEIVAIPWIVIYAKFREDILLNKKVFNTGTCFYRSVCMAAISYSDPILAILTNKRPLEEKRTCAKFQIDISKTEELVHVYTDRFIYMPYKTPTVQGIKNQSNSF